MGTPSDGLSKGRGFDREMFAVMHNMKEQRVLEKSLQTLKLEQDYALKLLQLDNRTVKVQYKKLKEKVSRIKSYLPAEDISKFRDLDARGKLKPTHCGVNIGSAITIAGAARRLNLGGTGQASRRGVKSALPRISLQREHTNNVVKIRPATSVGNSTNASKFKRRNSITGVSIDVPKSTATKKLQSSSVVSFSNEHHHEKTPNIIKEYSDLLTVAECDDYLGGKKLTRRVEDTLNSQRDNYGLIVDSPQLGNGNSSKKSTARDRRAVSAQPSSHSMFSSHTATEKDTRGTKSAMSSVRHDRTRRLSHISSDSIESNLGENMFEDRRQEMIEEENMRTRVLDEKTKLFIKDVEDYLEQHPPLQASGMAFENAPDNLLRKDSPTRPQTADSMGINSKRPFLFQRRYDTPENFADTPTFFPEDQYRQRLLALWTDMNKCRYLRVPDEKIDLSGVNTLVKDQMKLFESIRSAKTVPITGAWEG